MQIQITSGLKFKKTWLVKNKENNQVLSLLVDMTETLPALAQRWIGDVHGWMAFSTEDLTGSTGCIP
jgi:hypothetical protein